MPTFRHRTELPHSAEEVFAWHARPGAFSRLVPPWESVRILSRTGGLEVGSRVTLRMRKGPVPLIWEVEHTEVEPGSGFVDEQVRGPFARWRHEHSFSEPEPGRTIVEDRIDWEPPLGTLGRTFSGAFIQESLERLFAFRGRRLQGDLALHQHYGWGEGRAVAVTGSTGLIGENLVSLLRSGGYRVLRITRSERSGSDFIQWDPSASRLDGGALEGLDAVVHLAGESIAGVRWTASKKERILRSREEGTRLLTRTLAELKSPPGTLISASGVNFYGNRGDEWLTEASESGDGFLAEVCRRWERATGQARAAGIRTVRLRTGGVLTPLGGLLGTVLIPFSLGLGGRVGTGQQFMSWIDLDDHTGLILHALRTPELEGPVNATAPGPVRNVTFTKTLGRVLRRPTLFPVPALAVRAGLGEMGTELLLSGQRAAPEKAKGTGHRFQFPELEDSLRHQLGRTADAKE